MRILIFGAGAVGQGVGAFLAAAGHSVTLLLRRRYRDALSQQGLRVSGIFGGRALTPDQFTLAADNNIHVFTQDGLVRKKRRMNSTPHNRDTARDLPHLLGEPDPM